jgi:hypothetical protein
MVGLARAKLRALKFYGENSDIVGRYLTSWAFSARTITWVAVLSRIVSLPAGFGAVRYIICSNPTPQPNTA